MPEFSNNKNGRASSVIRVRPMVFFLLIFAVSLGVILGGIRFFYRDSTSQRVAESVADSPSLTQPLQPSPAHPMLPWEDMQLLRKRQQSLLQNGGPIPDDRGHVRIPIDQAIDQLLKSGALTRPWTPTTQPWQRPANEAMPSVENRT